MFSQTFELHDLLVILVLIVLEGVLSIDNALVLGLLARRLPEDQRRKALTYGLIGAFAFRVVAILFATWLLRTRIVKLLGGGYLVYLAIRHIFFSPHGHVGKRAGQGPNESSQAPDGPAPATFWRTIVAIELTDIAFAVDSILAAIALIAEEKAPPPGQLHPKLWVVVTGGMLGVVLVRFAAAMFIRLLDRFARFETAAYLLVLVIGGKLVIDWAANKPGQPVRIDFQSPGGPMFWIFWGIMALCFCVGFIPRKKPVPQ